MARCLKPRTIKSPAPSNGTRFGVYLAASRYARDNIIRRTYEEIVVPCGKCLACLKNKQSSMVVRCKREAQQKGSFAFMTLTYDDDHLPLTRSLFRVDKDTGEVEVFFKPEFISSGINPDPSYTELFKQMEASTSPRYFDYVWDVPDPDFEYHVRITPSVCRSDVREWLKMARIQYERDNGEKLPDFSYVAISEYGPRTCRPHYHLAFFGLQRKHLNYLLERWKYGKVKQVRIVAQVNADGSNGFLKASKYIGKYMSKGKFECDSVKECAAERPRVCQSKHLGTKELEPIRRQVLCFDIAGEYDPDSLRSILGWDEVMVTNEKSRDYGKVYRYPIYGDFLPRSVVDVLVDEIPRRLVYRVDERTLLPLPRIIRDKIFKNVPNEEYDEWLRTAGDDHRTPAPSRTVSSALWCMVTSSLRDKLERESNERFAEFCASHPEREAYENCLEFARWEEFCAGLEEATMFEDYRTFYSKSHF